MNITKVETPEELELAYGIRKTVFVDEQKVPMELELDEFEDSAIHFVCYVAGKPVGTSRLRLVSEFGKLERIAVLKSHRGQSIGSTLINRMEKEIASNQMNVAKLNAQTHATAFYEELGYRVISDEFMDAGIPHVTMIKQLNN